MAISNFYQPFSNKPTIAADLKMLKKNPLKFTLYLAGLSLILIGVMLTATNFKNFSLIKQPAKPAQTCDKCNILLIDIDIFRADALPCYGYFRNTAPNICEFASKSTLFSHNYSQTTWTLPSTISTITSLYPTFHNMRTIMLDKLDTSIPTLAETLQQNGYHTVAVKDSEFNLAFLTPENGGTRGYDVVTDKPIAEVINQLSQTEKPWFVHYYLSRLHMPYLIEEGEKPIADLPKPANLPITYPEFHRSLNKYLKQNYTEIFQKETIKKYQSLFLEPDDGSQKIVELFYTLNFDNPNPEVYLVEFWRPEYITYFSSFDPTKPSDVAYVRMMYDTEISKVDAGLAPLLAMLDAEKFVKNTIAVISSDHGENFGEYGQFNHLPDNHSQLFHTPLIIRVPNLKPQVINQASSNMDIFPTLIDLVGVDKNPSLQGITLAPLMNSGTPLPREFAISDDDSGIYFHNQTWLYLLPSSKNLASESILYNKIIDPTEQINVAKQYPELVKKLYDQAMLLRSYDKKIPFVIGSETKSILTQEKVDRMRTEGYF